MNLIIFKKIRISPQINNLKIKFQLIVACKIKNKTSIKANKLILIIMKLIMKTYSRINLKTIKKLKTLTMIYQI